MRKLFLVISLLACACVLQAQLWTKIIDSIPQESNSNFRRVVNDTVTNTLYIGGYFAQVNQLTCNSIVKYNGSAFDTLGSGLNDFCPGCATIVGEMTMFQNKLYVFGSFIKAGKYYGQSMARWNGTSWDSLDNYPNGSVDKIDVYNNELYVAGTFDSIGGIAANCVAKFDGVNWHSMAHPVIGNQVSAIKNFKGKTYLAAQVTSLSSTANLSYWDGSNWIPWVGVSGDVAKGIYGISVIDTMMYVYGRFNSIAGTNCKGLAAYNGSRWFGFGSGLSNSSWETIYNVQKINNDIYISGHFNSIEGLITGTVNSQVQMYTNIVKFDGQKLCTISPPFSYDVNGVVYYNNNLYAYGAFKKIGQDSVWGFVKWNGGNSTIACSPTIAITAGVVGLNELIEFCNLKLYPNPAKDNLTIECTNVAIQQTQIDILNAQGQLVYTSALTQLKKEIDLSAYSQGIYFIKLHNIQGQKVFKIVKE